MALPLTRRAFLGLGALLLAGGSPPAVAVDDPVSFAQSLYRLENLWDDVLKDRDQYLTEEFIAVVEKNDKYRNNPDFALDYDPLAQAQDWDIESPKFTEEKSGEGKATIRVDFVNDGEPTTVRLDLVLTPKGWRLADLKDAEGFSILKEYGNLNADAQD